MAFLTIAGVDYDVSTQDAGERTPRLIGATAPTFDGGLRSSRRERKRVWQFTLGPMDVPTCETLLAAVAVDTVPVSGDALHGLAVTALVDVTQVTYVSALDAVRSHTCLVQVTISES